jgi:hypothetical protein
LIVQRHATSLVGKHPQMLPQTSFQALLKDGGLLRRGGRFTLALANHPAATQAGDGKYRNCNDQKSAHQDVLS